MLELKSMSHCWPGNYSVKGGTLCSKLSLHFYSADLASVRSKWELMSNRGSKFISCGLRASSALADCRVNHCAQFSKRLG
jgi:hypothetical protein